jgi:dipeptidase E
MRLYLSSFKIGNHPDRLAALARPGTRARIIVNALDNSPHARKEWLASQSEALKRLGFVPEELDLRKYFAWPERLAPALACSGLIWINGGNAFLLRRAMRQSGFDTVARALLESDEIVYAGFSAAVCCATPTLRGIEIVDDPNAAPPGYMSETVGDGLGLINYNVAVHYGSQDAQGEAIERTIAYWKSQNMPYLTLSDGEVLVVDREKVEVVR